MATYTTHYNYYQPAEGDGILNGHTWGLQINDNFALIDAQIYALIVGLSGGGLPAYSPANNGQIVSVVAGALAWINFPTPPTATASALGMVKMATAPEDPENPLAVGDNDPRLTDARTPTAHASTHAPDGSDPIPSWLLGIGTTGEKPAPSPANAGKGFFDTTLEQLQASTGTAWVNIGGAGGTGGGGDTFTYFDPDKPPASPHSLSDEFNDGPSLDASWIQVNWSTLSSSDVDSTVPGCLFASATNMGNNIACGLKALPAGDFSVYAKIENQQSYGSPNNSWGLLLTNSSTAGSGSQQWVRITQGASQSTDIYGWSGFNSVGGAVTGNIPNHGTRYVRIRRSGSTYYWGWSPDGKTWIDFQSNPGFTPTHFGFAISSVQPALAVFSFEFIRFYESATATLGGVRTVTGS